MSAPTPAALIVIAALVLGAAMPVASQQPPATPQPPPTPAAPTQPAPPGLTQPPGMPPVPRSDSTAKPAMANVPIYRPPLRGAPGGRVGGGSRGTSRDVFVLSVLAPDHSGLTLQEQPPLYWFISAPTSFQVEVTISDPRATRPLVEAPLPAPVVAGIHTIRLADYNVRLTPGVQYHWFVAVVPDAARRSRDILAGGTIERVDSPAALRARLAQARPEELPFVYAEAGIWYDALAAVSELIERAPADRQFRQQRASLLSQVGLPSIDDGQGGAVGRNAR